MSYPPNNDELALIITWRILELKKKCPDSSEITRLAKLVERLLSLDNSFFDE